ncbi:MAG TPA: hypothetical protein VIK99_06200 [Thermaerobacter sp.]
MAATRGARITPQVVALRTRLEGMGVKLVDAGGRLRVEAPPGALSDELKQAIRRHKDALLALIRLGEPSAPARDDGGERRELLAGLHRHGVRVWIEDGELAMSGPAPERLRAMIRRNEAWLREELVRRYDHDRALDVTAQVIHRATSGMDGSDPLPEAARAALDDVDRAAVAEDWIGLLAALARFESEVAGRGA